MTKQEIEEYVSKYVNHSEAHASVKVRDYGFCVKAAAEVDCTTTDLEILTPLPESASNTKISSSSIQCSPSLLEFMNHLCPGEAENILMEDVLSNRSTILSLAPVATAYLYFVNLKTMYESKQKRKHDTKLTSQINAVDEVTRKVAHAFKEVGALKLPHTLVVEQLAARAVHKIALLTEATKQAISLKNLVSDRQLLNGLRRRLSQHKSHNMPTLPFTVQCVNSSSCTWQEEFLKLDSDQNSGSTSQRAPLSSVQLVEIGKDLEQNVSFSAEQIRLSYNIDPKLMKEVLHQLIFTFPVRWLHSPDNDVIVNLHELLLLAGVLDSLLSIHTEPVVSSTANLSRHH